MSNSSTPKGAGNLRAHDPAVQASAPPALAKVGGVAGWVDDRTGIAKPIGAVFKKVFPDHWSFMLGEIAMYSLIILLISGTFLTFWFVPSSGLVEYQGSYVPLKGVMMSEAYRSTVDISFDIRGGLVIRQIHHWSALLFTVSIMVHMMRVFFTGAFRKPREINWVIGTVLSMLSIVEGFAGYSLPDDLLSGTGLRAAEGFMQSVPVVGSYLAYFVFDGAFPGDRIIPRLFTVHVLLLPAAIVGLFTAHIVLVLVQKHTQYPGPGRTNNNVVGYPLMPVYIAKAGGFFFMVFGVTALLAALVQINPIWGYGPYEPTAVSAGAQPDWYMGFADGALRLLPRFLEFTLFGNTYGFNVFIGAILLIPVLYTMSGAYPFLERWVTGDTREHHLLDRPRNAPTRTAIGVVALTFYGILFAAAGNDIIAITFNLSINDITNVLRASLLVLPPIVFWVTKRICLGLQRKDRELVLHGRETGRIVRTADGRFFEAHEPISEYERWPLVAFDPRKPIEFEDGLDQNGVLNPRAAALLVRSKLTHFYFTDRVDPVTPSELAAAHHDGAGHEALDERTTEYVGAMHGGAEQRALPDGTHPFESEDEPEPDLTR